MEGGGAIFDPYQKIIHFNKREGRVARGPKWITYWNDTKVTTRATTINHKNLVVIIRFGGSIVKFGPYLRKVWFLKEGNEGVEVEGGVRRPLPPLDGRVQLPQNGICLHEGRTPDLS